MTLIIATPDRRAGDRYLVTLQAALCAVALAFAIFWPPASGAMLAIPLGRADASLFAVAANARIMGKGSLSGSLVLSGRLSDLYPLAIAQGILLVDAVPAGCGASGIPENAE